MTTLFAWIRLWSAWYVLVVIWGIGNRAGTIVIAGSHRQLRSQPLQTRPA